MNAQYPSFVRAEIENWIAWCWAGESPEPRESNRCYSAERSWLAPDWESESGDVPPKIIFNPDRAAKVQAIFDGLPQLTRRVLQYEYTQRSRYDLWERSVEMHEGEMRPVWIRVDNNRRQRARIDLKISRDQYMVCLDEFKIEVFKEFEYEVCV
ncbi:hypothetical protein [Castellaniella sp.]|uniref:hypothetical protein n=1 Tax=Castellaniella sp. TaxID=1955812 RepID=UPI002AFF1336|nr:hypothetical protein [Castellaniella sp.]